MFTAALFVIAPSQKQSKYLSTGEQVNKILFSNKKELRIDNML